jgi:ketosteroid isomerase-like protein
MIASSKTFEERLLEVEDRLAILNLLAGGSFSSDAASASYQTLMYTEDAVMDRGPGRGETAGRENLVGIIRADDHLAAIDAGMAHVAGLPHIEVDGDRAVATGYIEIVIPNLDGPEAELAEHGSSKGLMIWRLTANRWVLSRTSQGWQIRERVIRPVASQAAVQILRDGLEPSTGA